MPSAVVKWGMVVEAIAWVAPAINALIEQQVLPNTGYHVVVCDPNYRHQLTNDHDRDQANWERSGILFQCSYGPPEIGRIGDQITPVNAIARSKAFRSSVNNCSTRYLLQNRIFTLEFNDTIYFGSAVREGWCVAISGFPPDLDEMVSNWIIDALLAICRLQAEQIKLQAVDGFLVQN